MRLSCCLEDLSWVLFFLGHQQYPHVVRLEANIEFGFTGFHLMTTRDELRWRLGGSKKLSEL
jgi:hypothetical protein